MLVWFCGELHENIFQNADERHFLFNMDNRKTIGIIGDNDVKHAYVVSGGVPVKMIVRLTRGVQAMIQPQMLIFKN